MARPNWKRIVPALLVFSLAGLLYASSAFASVTRYEETDASVAYTGTWTSSFLPGHSGGSVAYSTSAPGATATLTFTGTGVDWIVSKWYNRGYAAVSLDGGPEQLVDLYAPGIPGDVSTVSYQQPAWFVRNLANEEHTLRIRVTGTGSASAVSPYLVTVDAFDVYDYPVVSTPASSPWSVALIGMVGFAVAAATRRRLDARRP